MEWLYRLQQRLALTAREARTLLALLGLLLLGLAARHLAPVRPPAAIDPVAAADSVFARLSTLPPPAPAGPDTLAAAPAGPLDLNAATAAELERLPGVGPTLAARIVRHREEQGPFGRVEDVSRVRGIGPKLLARIRPHAVVRDG